LCTKKFENVEQLKELQTYAKLLGISALKKWCRMYLASLINGDYSFIRDRIMPQSVPLNIFLKSIFEESKFCDFQLKITESHSIPCHKAILARAEFFSGLFHSGMSESNTGELQLDDFGMSHTTFQKFLYYLYSNEIEHISEIEDALQIYSNAGYYGITTEPHIELLESCFQIIKTEISVENCLDIFKQLPSVPHVVKLKNFLLDFIVSKYEEIAKNPELAHLPSVLFQEINIAFNLWVLNNFKTQIK